MGETTTASGERDPGPMARLREVCADPTTMGVLAQRLADGEKLKEICKAWGIPYGAFQEWLLDDEERSAKYRRAKGFAAINDVDEAVTIADEATPETISVDKERIKIRTFRASRLAREEYGERQDVNLKVEDNRPVGDREAVLLETARSLAFVLASAADVAGMQAQRPRLAAPIDVTPTKKEETNATEPDLI